MWNQPTGIPIGKVYFLRRREASCQKKTKWSFHFVNKSHLARKFVKLGIGGTMSYHECALNVKNFQPETLKFVCHPMCYRQKMVWISRPNLQNLLMLGWTKIIGIYFHDSVNRWNLTTLRNDKNFDDPKIVIRKVDVDWTSQVPSTMALLVLKNLGEGYKISLILSEKWMSFKEIAVFCELSQRWDYKN